MSALPFTIATKRVKYRNTTNTGCEGPLQGELQTTAQRNKRGHKQMEKHSMLMVRKNQYCENGHTAHPATIDFFHRIGGKKHLKLHLEPKKSSYSQDNTKKKSNAGSIMLPDFKLCY